PEPGARVGDPGNLFADARALLAARSAARAPVHGGVLHAPRRLPAGTDRRAPGDALFGAATSPVDRGRAGRGAAGDRADDPLLGSNRLRAVGASSPRVARARFFRDRGGAVRPSPRLRDSRLDDRGGVPDGPDPSEHSGTA